MKRKQENLWGSLMYLVSSSQVRDSPQSDKVSSTRGTFFFNLYTHVNRCMCANMYAHTYLCTHAHMYIHTCKCMHTHSVCEFKSKMGVTEENLVKFWMCTECSWALEPRGCTVWGQEQKHLYSCISIHRKTGITWLVSEEVKVGSFE